MTSILFSSWNAIAPVQEFLRRLVGSLPPTRIRGERSDQKEPAVAARSVLPDAACGRRRSLPRTRSRPRTAALRVVQVLDAGQTPVAGGRMRIYGRMADVCAELDRMVERESSLNARY